MCHPEFLPEQPTIPPLQAFLPHPWHPHFPPTQQTSTQQPTTQHPDNLLPIIQVPATWTNGSSIFPKPPLTQEQLSLLQKGPNYAITPKYPPIEAYITSTEQAANKLPTQEADELRSYLNKILKQLQQQHNKQCNLNPSQCRALTQLKKDNTRVVLTADKGVAMVIMDQQDYINKAQSLLQDTNTYNVLPKDLTSHLKNKLITLLKDIKQTEGLNTQKYKKLYPPVQSPQDLWPAQNP